MAAAGARTIHKNRVVLASWLSGKIHVGESSSERMCGVGGEEERLESVVGVSGSRWGIGVAGQLIFFIVHARPDDAVGAGLSWTEDQHVALLVVFVVLLVGQVLRPGGGALGGF